MTEAKHTAGAGYAFGQLDRALRTAQDHPDAATRARALTKIARWQSVLTGMRSGTLTVGSRTPVAKTPAWVTLEVAHGGFATGSYLAEGALREHENALLETLPKNAPGTTPRERLNLYFTSDEGLARLQGALADGRYEVEVPEEAALLVVAWLVDQGQGAAALELLSQLRSLMHRLRFYPRITDAPRASAAGVHVTTARKVRDALLETKPSAQVSAMNATLAVWNPLYDALVALWLRTVEGPAPSFQREEARTVLRKDAKGQPIAEGGWPGRVWPSDWSTSRDLFLAQYRAALRSHGPSGRHHAEGSTFQILLRHLRACPADASALSERALASLRHALAAAVHKHGAPDSEAVRTLREEQRRIASLPLHADIAAALAARLSAIPRTEGVASLDVATAPIEAGEHSRVATRTEVPARFVQKIERALIAPVESLVQRGIISSAEVLAIVLPQLTSQIAAAGISDPGGRNLFASIYAAFRRRRSLLLLNLEYQVQLEELPWIAALEPFRRESLQTQEVAAQAFRDLVLLTFEHFPHTIIPNPLLREFRTLAKKAGIKVPLVEEIAADIFMGTFTKKFGDAARLAYELLEGTLYARYYDLSPIAEPAPRRGLFSRWGKQTDPGFGTLCGWRAKEAGAFRNRSDGGGFVAQNGAELEQMQILTTYNLASLVVGLDLHRELERRGAELARKALSWALTRQAQLPRDRMARLRLTKNTAYAWRQAIFFLSFADSAQQRQVVGEIRQEFGPYDLKHLAPALDGLSAVVRGARFDAAGRRPSGERRFLGWSCGPHWALPIEPRQ
ncbi:MAG: hypothetical protein AAGE52_30870 [Myxococcota bacterium]